MSFNRYSLSTTEYYNQGKTVLIDYLKNIEPEFRKLELENFIKKVKQYDLEKKYYDSLSEEEKIKIEIEEFQLSLQKEIEETRNIRFMLTRGKTYDESKDNEYDNDFFKTLSIILDFEVKIAHYKETIESKIANLRFDPPLTEDKKRELVNRMIINEYDRLNNNLISYNYFLYFLSSYYKSDNKVTLSNFESFKINILMFLLDVDYERNPSVYEDYDFPEIPISIIENHIKRDGREDDFTLKAKNKKIAKILRDAASHGEFYPNDQRNNFVHAKYKIQKGELIMDETNIIRIENSKGVPRIGINLQSGILKKFIMSNLSLETRKKYDFLIKIIESKNFDDAIINSLDDDLNQMLILMLNNIVQYNLEHHFNGSENKIDNLNLTMFNVYDENNNGVDITSSLSNKEKLMIIKNAIGHDHVTWNNNELVFINEWTPSNPRDTREPVRKKITCSKEQILEFILQYDLYYFTISNQVDNSIINKF